MWSREPNSGRSQCPRGGGPFSGAMLTKPHGLKVDQFLSENLPPETMQLLSTCAEEEGEERFFSRIQSVSSWKLFSKKYDFQFFRTFSEKRFVIWLYVFNGVVANGRRIILRKKMIFKESNCEKCFWIWAKVYGNFVKTFSRVIKKEYHVSGKRVNRPRGLMGPAPSIEITYRPWDPNGGRNGFSWRGGPFAGAILTRGVHVLE